MEVKYKGRNERWFQANKRYTSSGDLDDAIGDNSGDKVNVARDTILKFLCKCGKLETMEFYRILRFFNKYYNNWFPSVDGKFVSGKHGVVNKNPRVLARIMENTGSLI